MIPYTLVAAKQEQQSTRELLKQFKIVDEDTFSSLSKYTILVVFDISGSERVVASCVAVHFRSARVMEISMLRTGECKCKC